jgi:hypothetical protein
VQRLAVPGLAPRAALAATLGMTLAMMTAAVGCRGEGDKAGARRAAAAWQATCGPALARLRSLPPEQRAGAVLDACPVCELGPIRIDRRGLKRGPTYLPELEAAMHSCGGFCSQVARKDFMRGIHHQADEGRSSPRPWRKLAEDCPVELGARDDSRNFVGATWFLLERIARAAGRELPAQLGEAAPFPLPAVAEGGRGPLLPSVPAALAAPLVVPGRLAVTVLAEQAMVGRLPWARLAAAGIAVDGDYPGQRADQLAPALAEARRLLASLPDGPAADLPITLAAPAGLPARRLAEVLGQLGAPARLAVAPDSALPEYAPPMALPQRLVGGEAAAAAPAASSAVTLVVGDSTAAATAAATLATAAVQLQLGADTTVAQVVELLARLPAGVVVRLAAPPPGSAPAAVPGSAPAAVPGNAPAAVPGSAPAAAPGSAPAAVPASPPR